MNNLLTQRHPDILDIGETQAAKILKYTSLDENGKVLECLQRATVETDFVDITEIEKERLAAIAFEKELNKLKRRAEQLKEQEEQYGQESDIADKHD